MYRFQHPYINTKPHFCNKTRSVPCFNLRVLVQLPWLIGTTSMSTCSACSSSKQQPPLLVCMRSALRKGNEVLEACLAAGLPFLEWLSSAFLCTSHASSSGPLNGSEMSSSQTPLHTWLESCFGLNKPLGSTAGKAAAHPAEERTAASPPPSPPATTTTTTTTTTKAAPALASSLKPDFPLPSQAEHAADTSQRLGRLHVLCVLLPHLHPACTADRKSVV